ncbi:uncharacterized protein [Rutidosis leptorrhynchoides]|uniref:uncharacterized protein n=1 Tax=Rutidosis leptorrhynchoides TaxID=125765 RepID=UPI003A9A4C9B
MAVEPYTEVNISVLWDIDDCQVPNDCEPGSIANNVTSALKNMGYCGPISITAYGDLLQIPRNVKDALHSSGVVLYHVPEAARSCPERVVCTAAKSVWVWSSLLAGGPPITNPNVEGPIRVILDALKTLEVEKIIPNIKNIVDCIRYGDTKQSIDVKEVLDSAIEQQLVVKHCVGSLSFFSGKDQGLWECIHPTGSDVYDHSKQTWDELQKFLTTNDGRCAIEASSCRYEAACIIKRSCLEKSTLGEIFQILDLVIKVKKWIRHHPSGWQPVTVTPPETNLPSDPEKGCFRATNFSLTLTIDTRLQEACEACLIKRQWKQETEYSDTKTIYNPGQVKS